MRKNTDSDRLRFRGLQFLLFFLLFFLGSGITFLRITDVNKLQAQERSARILLLNFQSCGDIYQISREYGEGTMTVKCTNGKAYLLVALEHCDRPFTAYCWKVKDLDSKTLELKR